MKLKFLFTAVAALVLSSTAARALPIDAFTGSVSANSPLQYGRLSRNSHPQDWQGTEATPATINTGTLYNYTTYTYRNWLFSDATYIDLSVFDETNAGTFFVSAYAGSYDPTNQQANFLGDVGTSGNYIFNSGTLGDPRFFDVRLPFGSDLIIVVNTTSASGIGAAYDIAINAFTDDQYTDSTIAPVPEPSSLLLVGTGALGVVGALRRRFSL